MNGTTTAAISPSGSATRRSIAEQRNSDSDDSYSDLLASRRNALFAATGTGRRPGASRSRSPTMTWSSSAAAAMGLPPPIISPRSTASPMSRCWKRAGSAPAMSAATPRSSARTICCPATPVLRMVDEAVGGAGAGFQFQRHGVAARRAQPRPLRSRSAMPLRGAAMPCACTASMPNSSIASGSDACCPFLDFDNARFPILGRPAAAARRHGAP